MEVGDAAQNFKKSLENLDFPTSYLFKFIVPVDKLDDITQILSQGVIKRRLSKNGKYVSVTSQLLMKSSDEVIAIYVLAKKIPGIISL